MIAETYRKGYFTIDSFGKQSFEGYTTGMTWNGFATPYFEKDVALRIVELFKGNDFEVAKYNEDEDVIMIGLTNQVENIEAFEGTDIEVGGQVVHVYPVGAYSWVWDEIPNAKLYKNDSYFKGDVLLSYYPKSESLIEVDLWVYSDTPYVWSLEVEQKFIQDILLEELKNGRYITSGYSETL